MAGTKNLTLYRAAKENPLLIPSKETYGDQYALYQLADRMKPRHSRGRLDSIFAGLSAKEATHWGDRVFELKAEVPFKDCNAYDISKWTKVTEYYLAHAFEDTPETNTRLDELIEQYWASKTPIKKVLQDIEENPEGSHRWEILLPPDCVTGYSEIQEGQREIREEGRILSV